MNEPNDGGPMFPQPFIYEEGKGAYGQYTSAFDIGLGGISLRAWLAGQALATLTPQEFPDLDNAKFFADGAQYCVAYADAVLAELAKPKP